MESYDDRQDADRRKGIFGRVGAVAGLLNRAANAKNLNILHYLGYFDDKKVSRIGYILALPKKKKVDSGNASAISAQPPGAISSPTLYSLLGGDMTSSSIPDLGSRITLALALGRNLLQLHAAGWLHKGLRYENILFFHSIPKSSEAPNISDPYLAGFEYGRPDTDMAMTKTLTTYSETQDYYRHPASILVTGAANPVTSRFRR
jgi:hypothetical protein